MMLAHRRALILALAAAAVMLTVGCGKNGSNHSGRMRVAASIGPLAYFARQIGGDRVSVRLLVPPGASPHTYQLQPAQMEFLSDASVLVLNGGGLEFWADKAIGAADNPRLIVVRTTEGVSLLDAGGEHRLGNPHIWLDPILAIHQVEEIRDAFVKADPEHASLYEAHAANLVSRLRSLDKQIRAQVKTFKVRQFVAYHPAWVYFARRYGLEEAAVIEESPGKEASPAEIRRAIDTVRRLRAKAVFAEPQFSSKVAQAVADETGATVLFLNPMGRPPDYNYFRMMRSNVKEMEKGLGR